MALVVSDPKQAHARLVEAFGRLGSAGKVAEELGYELKSVYRWIKALEGKGYEDPRRVAERAGKAVKKFGIRRLSEREKAQIVRERAGGVPLTEVARKHGITAPYVSRIANRKKEAR